MESQLQLESDQQGNNSNDTKKSWGLGFESEKSPIGNKEQEETIKKSSNPSSISYLPENSDGSNGLEVDDEIKQVVNFIFEGSATQQQMQQLSQSLSIILDRTTKRLSDYECYERNFPSNFPYQQPSVNLILQYQQSNPFLPQNSIYQQLPPQIIPPNQYQMNMTPMTNTYVMGIPQMPHPYLMNQVPTQLPSKSSYSDDTDKKKKKKDKEKKKDKKKKEDKKKKDKKDKKEQDKKSSSDLKKQGIPFEYTGNNAFSGIFSQLRAETSNNIESVVQVTASSQQSRKPLNVIQRERRGLFGGGGYFNSLNEPNSWICFDFKDRRVIPTNYSIRTIQGFPNTFYPKNWVIEGSNDNSNWKIIDEQNDCSYLKGDHVSHTFTIQNKKSKEFRYIRMRQTGENWNGSNHLGMESFELFGTLI